MSLPSYLFSLGFNLGQDLFLKEQYYGIHPVKSYPDLMNVDYTVFGLSGFMQVFHKDHLGQALHRGRCQRGKGVGMSIPTSGNL